MLAGLFLWSATGLSQRRHMMETFTTDMPMVHDPVMAYEDSTYYLFATSGRMILYRDSATMYGHPTSSNGTDVGGSLTVVQPLVRTVQL